jgi:hypothetical protein
LQKGHMSQIADETSNYFTKSYFSFDNQSDQMKEGIAATRGLLIRFNIFTTKRKSESSHNEPKIIRKDYGYSR